MASSLKIIFAGTPDFAAASLQALLRTSHEVVAVYTQPDRPSGRGRKLSASPVKALANAHHIPVYQPVSLRDPLAQQTLSELKADLMVVVAYGLILPLAVLNAPRLGCINVHGSLLPAWRGAAPIQRAVLAGDTTTGITIMQMDVGLDTGPMLSQTPCPILPIDTSESLYHTLAEVGASALVETLDQLSAGLLRPIIQDEKLATHAAKMTKEEANIDWHQAASVIERQVRGFNPWPIAYTQVGDQTVRVWKSDCVDSLTDSLPGTVLAISPLGLDVATGEGVLRLQEIQFAGGRAMSIADYLNGSHLLIKPGTLLGSHS